MTTLFSLVILIRNKQNLQLEISEINTSDITDNKIFWKIVRPFLRVKQKQNLK